MAKWTKQETADVIKLYRRMLKLQNAGKLGAGKTKTSKAVLVREFMVAHDGRSKGSVEAKLMNVSYCCQLAGLPTVIGYKSLANCSNDMLELFKIERAEIVWID